MRSGHFRVSIVVAVTAALVAGTTMVARAQPTFGRPKEDRPMPGKPSDPNAPQTSPDAAEVMAEWQPSDPARLSPSPDAELGVWHTAKTSEGYRYAWSLPAGFERGRAYNMVVILHPAGRDFRWGMNGHGRAAAGKERELDPGRAVFRPRDIVVSIDGLTGMEENKRLRTFEVSGQENIKFRDVMLEISRELPTQRIYLYGKEEGGAFALGFAQAFPALCDGLVIHGSELPEELLVQGTAPVVLIHGARDGRVPLKASISARKAMVDAGHELAFLRVLRSYNDYPNPSRADDAIEFVDAMLTTEPSQAVDSAERLLTSRGADEYDYVCAPWYAGAYRALLRASGKAKPEFADTVDAEVLTRATRLMNLIDAEGKAHVDELRELMQAEKATDLALDGGAWIGYAAALRDDFRGVPSVEKLFGDIGFDAVMEKQAEAALTLLEKWGDESETDAEKYVALVETLPSCYLYEAMPIDAGMKAKACVRKAESLGISADAKMRIEYVNLWEKGWREGLREYADRWMRWRYQGPKPPEPKPESTGEDGSAGEAGTRSTDMP